MTILASDIIDHAFLERLAIINPVALRSRPLMPFVNWLIEHRTFTVGLPRQTLKTSTLVYHTNENTLFIAPNEIMRHHTINHCGDGEKLPTIHPIFTPDSLLRFAMSGAIDQHLHRADGPSSLSPTQQFSQIFIDEHDSLDIQRQETVFRALDLLQRRHRLADNVFVLRVGTPR